MIPSPGGPHELPRKPTDHGPPKIQWFARRVPCLHLAWRMRASRCNSKRLRHIHHRGSTDFAVVHRWCREDHLGDTGTQACGRIVRQSPVNSQRTDGEAISVGYRLTTEALVTAPAEAVAQLTAGHEFASLILYGKR